MEKCFLDLVMWFIGIFGKFKRRVDRLRWIEEEIEVRKWRFLV